jgi:hypothetical protein
MKLVEILELESSFDSCFNELIYQLKQKGMNAEYYALITEQYRSLSAQIGTQLDLFYLDEQPLKD